MKSPLVERLRAKAADPIGAVGNQSSCELMREAADEIERLLVIIDTLQEDNLWGNRGGPATDVVGNDVFGYVRDAE